MTPQDWRTRREERWAAEEAIQAEFGLAAYGWDSKKCLAALASAIKERKRLARDLRREGKPTHTVDAELRMLQGGAMVMQYHVKGNRAVGYCCGWPAIWENKVYRPCSCGHKDPPRVPPYGDRKRTA